MRSEFELIGLLRERIAAAGAVVGDQVVLPSGDDAAVVAPRGNTVTTVDAIVEGIHFTRPEFPPDAIGHKALAVALSDLAAMGSKPGEAYVQLGLAADVSEDELGRIADGLGALAAEQGITVAGGDLVASPVLFLAMTAVGYVTGESSWVGRGGAQPGDALVLTGPLGAAAAGLRLLGNPLLASGLDPGTARALRDRQLRPRPLPDAGIALARAGARAMIDVSDGVAADAGHIASAGAVRCVVELSGASIAAGVDAVATAAGEDPLTLVTGGEDYELLAAVPPERLPAVLEAIRATGSDPALAGRVEAGKGVVLRGPTGREASAGGFDQVFDRVRSRG